MTTQQLLERIDVRSTTSYGHWKVTIQYRGKKYSCISNDSLAYDRHLDEDSRGKLYTQKAALQTLWNECKRKNNLY
jgi:hypothetical protein